MASTWALAFDRLRQTEPGAVGLLRLLAFYAPEAIPLELMLQSSAGLIEQLGPDVAPMVAPLLEGPLGHDKAIAALRRYSLVTSAADGFTSVHPLVQVVTRNEIPHEHLAQWHRAVAALIETAIPADTKSPTTWPVCAMMLPHAQKSLTDETVGMARIASYLGHSGSHTAARNLQARIAHACARVYGPEDPRTLNARHELAHWTGQAGDPAAARDQFADLLPIIKRAFGPEHLDTLTAQHNLAHWTGKAGDPAAAQHQFAELLPAIANVVGPRHPVMLRARVGLAWWTGEAGDPTAARDQLMDLLPLIERVFGDEHPETLTAQQNLAQLGRVTESGHTPRIN